MRIYVINGKKVIYRCEILVIILGVLALSSILFHIFSGNVSRAFGINASAEPKETVVIIDPGHGGEDPGAVGANGVLEKNLNLQIASIIGEMLKSEGITVIYTRTDDRMLYSEDENIKGFRKLSDLKNRCKVTEQYENPILLSIHMNSFGDSKYSGLQVYYTEENTDSYNLAKSIQDNTRESLQKDNNRVVKSGKGMYLLENCKGVGVIVECGFLTNADECKNLSEKEYQKQLSFAIVCGIIEYIKVK